MTPQVALPPFPERAVAAFEGAKDSPEGLRDVAASNPTYSAAWGELARHAYDDGDTIAAYAFARTGYHRGLDQLRRNGWKGFGPVPWDHEPNQGFLRSVAALARAAKAIGEADEVERCVQLVADCDPSAVELLGLAD